LQRRKHTRIRSKIQNHCKRSYGRHDTKLSIARRPAVPVTLKFQKANTAFCIVA